MSSATVTQSAYDRRVRRSISGERVHLLQQLVPTERRFTHIGRRLVPQTRHRLVVASLRLVGVALLTPHQRPQLLQFLHTQPTVGVNDRYTVACYIRYSEEDKTNV